MKALLLGTALVAFASAAWAADSVPKPQPQTAANGSILENEDGFPCKTYEEWLDRGRGKLTFESLLERSVPDYDGNKEAVLKARSAQFWLENLPFEATDCALPMIWARENELNVSGFITYTDSETWAGKIHPTQALRQYRSEFVGDAKAVVVGMTSNGFTLADPNDRGMLDVVGFDTTAPAVIADFIRNRLSTRAEANASVRAFHFRPVGRTAEAVVCKTT